MQAVAVTSSFQHPPQVPNIKIVSKVRFLVSFLTHDRFYMCANDWRSSSVVLKPAAFNTCVFVKSSISKSFPRCAFYRCTSRVTFCMLGPTFYVGVTLSLRSRPSRPASFFRYVHRICIISVSPRDLTMPVCPGTQYTLLDRLPPVLVSSCPLFLGVTCTLSASLPTCSSACPRSKVRPCAPVIRLRLLTAVCRCALHRKSRSRG